MKVENDFGYQDGIKHGEEIIKLIKFTEYKDLKTAIDVKQAVIDNFEKVFGYSREMDVEKFDRNYSLNLGILDTLKAKYKKEKEVDND